MALVSPGISISINDQSQYINSNVGSIPLVVLATAQDKTYNGASATGTSKTNAGMLQSFGSQRELVTALGTPTFQVSASGTPVNASELNEYGLLAAYSALGVSNQLYAIRADIDLNQLIGTSARPQGAPANNTYWLNTESTEWGIYALDNSISGFDHVSPLLITDKTHVFDDNTYAYNVPTPLNSVGSPGQYALVFVDTNGLDASVIRLFYKTTASALPTGAGGPGPNTWVQVGGTNWQNSIPVATGIASSISSGQASSLNSATFIINGVTVTMPSTETLNIGSIATAINGASITGVKASTYNGRLTLFVTSAAKSGGSGAPADGKLLLTDGTNTPLSAIAAISLNTCYCPYLFYGNYAQAPAGGWFATDTQPRPSGSIWWKTSATGTGFSPVLENYNANVMQWSTLNTPMFQNFNYAVYGLDPTGGGINISHGQTFADFDIYDTTANGLKFYVQKPANVAVGTGGQLQSATPFTASNTFNIFSSTPGTSAVTTTTITLSGTTAQSFVTDVLAANIPYVSAAFNSTDGTYGSISIIHTAGGQITLAPASGTPLTAAQFVSGKGTGFVVNTYLNKIVINNWSDITSTITYQSSEPYTAPASGTYWYYSNPADIDIMINNNGWKGYQNVTSDVRGYNLSNTDSNGVIISAGTAPVAQSTGANLVAGDLWLDISNLVDYPALSRYNGSTWVSINTADHTSSNGIIFADARWDVDGTTDVISGSLIPVTEMLSSNYIDQDAPDYRLYPRGTLLFNTRRSGYNVKQFVYNKFNATAYPTPGLIPGSSGSLPAVTSTWQSASGLNSNGVMYAGSAAQRAIVVAALASAVDSNTDIIEDIYNFNLLVCPGYPEITSNLINLNNNRSNTGFVIGDTPITLAPNTVDITNWVNNTDGTGLPAVAATDPYTGLYYPAGLTNDLAGNTVVVPASHAALRTFLYSDQISYPWFAPAGVNRGLVSNLNNIGYVDANSGSFVHNGINQGLRDALYPLKINPLTQLPGTGIVIWGQQTRSADTSSRDSINVVRLENYLRTIFKSISNGYLFEPNDNITRTSIARQIEGALNDVLAKRGVYDFLVICDTSNNTSTTIANQQLYVDVAIEPMRDVEFIYIPIALYNPGDISALQIAST